MTVQHYPPTPKLAPIIAYYWTVSADAKDDPSGVYRLIPDGYVDWVFHLQTPWDFYFQKENNVGRPFQAHYFSHIKKYIEIRLPEQDMLLFGVKFHPWTAHQVWQLNMGELTGQAVTFEDIGKKFLRQLTEQISHHFNVRQWIDTLETQLMDQLRDYRKSDLEPVVSHIFKNPTKLGEIDYCNSQRRLEQRFKEEIGISPKMLHRTVRINYALQLMMKSPELRLTDVAYSAGFYDQSHFIQDFNKFTGFSPRRFLKSIDPSGDFFNLKVG